MHNGIRSSVLACGLGVAGLLGTAQSASAQIQVTEWTYQATNGEFVELTNTGSSAINLTGWTFDDTDLADNNVVDLSTLGTLAAGESLLLIQGNATPTSTDEEEIAAFRVAWSLAASVKIESLDDIGFSRADSFNVFNNGVLVETFAFGDEVFPGSPRARTFTANVPPSLLASATATSGMPFSAVGDAYGSYASAGNDVGNPGTYSVPEPTTFAAVGGLALMAIRRTRR